MRQMALEGLDNVQGIPIRDTYAIHTYPDSPRPTEPILAYLWSIHPSVSVLYLWYIFLRILSWISFSVLVEARNSWNLKNFGTQCCGKILDLVKNACKWLHLHINVNKMKKKEWRKEQVEVIWISSKFSWIINE